MKYFPSKLITSGFDLQKPFVELKQVGASD